LPHARCSVGLRIFFDIDLGSSTEITPRKHISSEGVFRFGASADIRPLRMNLRRILGRRWWMFLILYEYEGYVQSNMGPAPASKALAFKAIVLYNVFYFSPHGNKRTKNWLYRYHGHLTMDKNKNHPRAPFVYHSVSFSKISARNEGKVCKSNTTLRSQNSQTGQLHLISPGRIRLHKSPPSKSFCNCTSHFA
jgi:hypothetical protein